MALEFDRNQTDLKDIDFRSHIPAGHFLLSKFGLIHEADQVGAIQLGVELPSLINSSFLSRVGWDDRDIFSKHLQSVLDKKERLSCEVRLVKNDASVFYSYIESLAQNNSGQTGDLCRTTVRDISLIRVLEERLRNEKTFTESLTRSSIDGIMAVDTICQIVEWNPAMEKMTGITRRECIGKNVFTVFPFLKKIGEDRYLDAALKGRKVTSKNRHYHAPRTGRKGFFEAHYSPVKDDNGNVSGGIAIIKDITDSKKQETEYLRAKKLETVGLLASGFAHDYNNLLIGILGKISLAKLSMNPGEKTYDLVDEASKIALRARDLTRQLTMLASGEAHTQKPAFVGPVLRDLSNLTLSDSDILWECELNDELWPVEVNEAQFWQAIHTILVYVKESSPKGSRVHISATNAIIARDSGLPLLEGRYVLIAATQNFGTTSSGGTAATRDPFSISAVEAGKADKIAELSTAYSIINNHQGLITVEANADTDNTFNIFLPATMKSVSSHRKKVGLPIQGKGKILIMDDDEDVRDIAGKILNQMGYNTAFAQDGEEALRAYMDEMNTGKPFDIVILDLNNQEGMSGKEAITRLIDIDPDVRAIASSVHSLDHVMVEFTKYGFKGAITKPFKIGDLSETISTII